MNLRELVERADREYADSIKNLVFSASAKEANYEVQNYLHNNRHAIAELIEAQQAWFVAQGYYDAALTAETTHNAHVQMQQAEIRIRAALAKLGGK